MAVGEHVDDSVSVLSSRVGDGHGPAGPGRGDDPPVGIDDRSAFGPLLATLDTGPKKEATASRRVITAMSTARTNKVAIACCDRAGVERGQQWTEGTAIIDPDGWVVASAGPGRAMAVADVDLAAMRYDKTLTEFVDVFADRRVDLY